jgi:Tetratricopeptide repeat
MKMSLCFGFVICLGYVGIVLCADQNDCARAYGLYQEGKWEQACAAYDRLEHKNAAVLLAMAQCFYRTNDFDQAMAYLLRARKKSSVVQCQEINTLLMTLQSPGRPQQKTWAIDAPMRWMCCAAHLFALVVWQIIFLILVYGFLLLYWFGMMHSTWRTVAIAILAVVTIGWSVRYYEDNQYNAVLKKNSVLKTGPHQDYPLLKTIEFPMPIVVLEERNQWYKVCCQDQCAWVTHDDVMCIK